MSSITRLVFANYKDLESLYNDIMFCYWILTDTQ